MINFFSKNTFNRVICQLLTVVFLSSFPTGASAKALCLDEEENHLVDQNLYLVGCHASAETYLPLSDEHCSARAEKENNDCTDVSLTNAHILNRPSKVILPVSAKVILSCASPHSQLRFQNQVAGYGSSALSQPLFTSPHINAHRTVVLLI